MADGVNGWDAGFWRFVRYATVIGAGAWFAFTIKADIARVEAKADSLTLLATRIRAEMFSKTQGQRIMKESNEEHRRLWKVIGRSDMHHPIELE